jgi:Flp pilus assembly protein TadB
VGAVLCRTVWAVAALTVAAAFAVQHHRHRRRVRAMRAQQLAERLAASRAHADHLVQQQRMRAVADRLLADGLVVAEATDVIDRALGHGEEREGSGEDD